jgi:hypothetical protein
MGNTEDGPAEPGTASPRTRPTNVIGLMSDVFCHTDQLIRAIILILVLGWAFHLVKLPVREIEDLVVHYALYVVGGGTFVGGGLLTWIVARLRIRFRKPRSDRASGG